MALPSQRRIENGLPEQRSTLGSRFAETTLPQDARLLRYRPNETLFIDGDEANRIYYLYTGKVKVELASDPNGDNAWIQGFFKPPSLLGEPLMRTINPYSRYVAPTSDWHQTRAITMMPTVAISFNRDSLPELMTTNRDWFLRLLTADSCDSAYMTQRMNEVMSGDLTMRLGTALLSLRERGQDEVGPYSQDELAGYIRATRASVNKVLGWFEDAKVIKRVRQKTIAILHEDNLERIAQGFATEKELDEIEDLDRAQRIIASLANPG